jgi:hypothetical protein
VKPLHQSRRKFIKSTAVLTALRACIPASRLLAQPQKGQKSGEIAVTIYANEVVAPIPHDLLGLSYESSQLEAVDFFSAANTELIALFRRLSPNGILRLGGNLSEYTIWTPDAPTRSSPTIPFRAVGPDPSAKTTPAPAFVTPQAIRNLAAFLHATGWRTVYGLNLALADPQRVVSEARFVSATLGDQLVAFQIGNEPDHYVMNGLRPSGYTFDQYFSEWSALHAAVQSALPDARFAGPDIADHVDWIGAFAAKAPSDIYMLTGHHYAEGPPSDPSMTLERLLSPDADLALRVERTKAIADSAHIPYCMAETNSCFKAGKEGVSDVFGSALWAIDYMMQLVHANEHGVYFHGGANGWYTPIAGGSGKPFRPRPVYGGLLLCRELLGSDMIRVTMPPTDLNIAVYAFRKPDRLLIVNKDQREAVVAIGGRFQAKRVLWLKAPSPEERSRVMFGNDLLDSALQQEPFFERLVPSSKVSVPPFNAGLFDLSYA